MSDNRYETVVVVLLGGLIYSLISTLILLVLTVLFL